MPGLQKKTKKQQSVVVELEDTQDSSVLQSLESSVVESEGDEEGDEEDEEGDEGDEDEDDEEDDEYDDEDGIDLSQNPIYQAMSSLFEDSEGQNILQYFSLLHTELIGIRESLNHLEGIRTDIGRLSDVAEKFLKLQKKSRDEK